MDPWTQRVDYGVGFMKDMSELPVGNQLPGLINLIKK